MKFLGRFDSLNMRRFNVPPAGLCCQASSCHPWTVFQLLNVTVQRTDK